MPRKSQWPAGTEIRKTTIGLPKPLSERVRIQAVREDRNIEELVAEALEDYLRGKAKKGGKS